MRGDLQGRLHVYLVAVILQFHDVVPGKENLRLDAFGDISQLAKTI